jgi:hypothetical protein
VRKLILIIPLLIFINACSHNKGRRFASAKMAGTCFEEVRRHCSQKHPYTKIKKGFFELQYKYLNRKNKVHILYNDCFARRSLTCSQKHGSAESTKRFSQLVSNLNTDESLNEVSENTLLNNLSIPFLDLSAKDIKRVWQTVYLIKKSFLKLRDALGFVKDKSINGMHGVGVSASGSALLGIGGTLQVEAVIHNRKMALFCAPGITAQTDIGLSVDLGVFKTLGCKDNEDYQGKFLSFTAGVSGEAIGLPFNVGANYALGLGLSEFLEAMAREKKAGKLDLFRLAAETSLFSTKSFELMARLGMNPSDQFSYLIISKMIALSLGEKEVLSEFNNSFDEFKSFTQEDGIDKTLNLKPLAHHIKSFLKFILIMEETYAMDLRQFKMVVAELDKSISSCDAIGLTGGLSLTLSPVNIGTIIYQYSMLTEIDLDDVFYLAGFAPTNLYRLNLSAAERERFTKAVSGILKIIPDLWFNQCLSHAADNFSQDGENLFRILTD